MALPLTNFQALPLQVPTTPTVIYTSPVGYNTIFLQVQILNPDIQELNISLNFVRGASSVELFKTYNIPAGVVRLFQPSDLLRFLAPNSEVKQCLLNFSTVK